MSAWEFHVGQRVVCVDDSPVDGVYGPIAKGAIYTVAKVGIGRSKWSKKDVCLHLQEVPCATFFDNGYSHRRFRPLRERKTSIECFRALLNPTDKKVDA